MRQGAASERATASPSPDIDPANNAPCRAARRPCVAAAARRACGRPPAGAWRPLRPAWARPSAARTWRCRRARSARGPWQARPARAPPRAESLWPPAPAACRCLCRDCPTGAQPAEQLAVSELGATLPETTRNDRPSLYTDARSAAEIVTRAEVSQEPQDSQGHHTMHRQAHAGWAAHAAQNKQCSMW